MRHHLDDSYIVEHYRKGKSARQIACWFGVTHKVIYRRLKILGVPSRMRAEISRLVSNKLRGRPRSAETCAKIAAALRGKPLSAERCANISAALRGRKLPVETRARMAAARRGRIISAETRARLSAAMKGRPLTPEHRANMRGKKLSLEHRARIARVLKEWKLTHKDQVVRYRALGLKALQAKGGKNTFPEQRMAGWLTSHGIKYEHQRPFGPYIVDFYLPEHRTVVEVDGEYWHSLPGAKTRDHKRDVYLQSLGLRVRRIPAKQATALGA